MLDKNGWLVGVLSKKDCLKAALHAAYWRDWGQTVAEYMSRDVQSNYSPLFFALILGGFLQASVTKMV